MRTRLPILIVLVTLIVGLAGHARAKTTTAAVMPLGKGAGGPEFAGLGRALADMMVTDLSQAKALQLVERMKLGLILDELKLAKSGYRQANGAEVGTRARSRARHHRVI